MSANYYLILPVVFAAGLLLGLVLMWLIARARKERLEAELQHLPQLETQIEALQGERVQLHEKIATLETSRQALEQAQEIMRDAFQNLANQALKDNSEQFLARARDSLDSFLKQVSGGWQTHKAELQTLVQPLDQALKAMDQNLRELEGKREGAYGELRENLTRLNQMNQQLQTEAHKLSHALRAGVQQRGQWAEFQLQRLAEMAGMQQHVDFDLQVSFGEGRPDMVIWLPRGGCIVVDAKAPMTHYLEALEMAQEESRAKKLLEHVRRVRQHIDSLHSKEYARQLPESAEFVVMYIPSDACLIAALGTDRDLLEYAFHRRVTLATPTTFFALLKTVANGWQQYQITENAQRIFEQGQKLSHRLQTFGDHLAGVGRGLETALGRFNEAAGSYERMIRPAIRDFRKLGIDTEEPPEVKPIDTQPRQLQPPVPPDKPPSD
jgi:DNA recombination protein RmuC